MMEMILVAFGRRNSLGNIDSIGLRLWRHQVFHFELNSPKYPRLFETIPTETSLPTCFFQFSKLQQYVVVT